MSCPVNVRPIWRGWLTFALGPSARPCDRSTYTSMSSGRRPEPLASIAFGRQPCFAKSVAFVTLVEFVAILEPSVSLPRGVPRLPRPSSPNRGALLRLGLPLLAMRRASARGPRTGPFRLAQLDTRPLGLLLTRFFPYCRKHTAVNHLEAERRSQGNLRLMQTLTETDMTVARYERKLAVLRLDSRSAKRGDSRRPRSHRLNSVAK